MAKDGIRHRSCLCVCMCVCAHTNVYTNTHMDMIYIYIIYSGNLCYIQIHTADKSDEHELEYDTEVVPLIHVEVPYTYMYMLYVMGWLR